MLITVRNLRNPTFGKTMMKLDKCDKWPNLNAVKRFADLSEKIGAAFVTTNVDLNHNTLAFAKTKDGKPETDKNGAYVIDEQSQHDYNDMVNAFYAKEIDVNIEGIREKDLQTVGITPEDWSAIKWLVK